MEEIVLVVGEEPAGQYFPATHCTAHESRVVELVMPGAHGVGALAPVGQ